MKNQKQIIESPYMTTQQAQNYLQVARTTLYNWVNDGIVTLYKIGSANRFKRSELDEAVKPVIKNQ